MTDERRPSSEIREEVEELRLDGCAAEEGYYEAHGLDADGYYPDEQRPIYLHPEAIAFSCSNPLQRNQMIALRKVGNQYQAAAKSIYGYFKSFNIHLWPCRHPREIDLSRIYLTCHEVVKDNDLHLIYAVPVAIYDEYAEKMIPDMFGNL